MLEQADTDGDGTIDLEELGKVVERMLQEETRARNLKLLLKIGAGACLILIMCIVGLSTAVTFAMKDTFTQHSLLSDGNDHVIQTADAKFPVALLAAPVLGMDVLQTIDVMTMTLPTELNNATGFQKRAVKVTEVELISDTRVIFHLANGDEVKVWDGETQLVTKDDQVVELCETDISCSALTVSARGKAAQYLAEAEAALEAKGFGEVLRRRLG